MKAPHQNIQPNQSAGMSQYGTMARPPLPPVAMTPISSRGMVFTPGGTRIDGTATPAEISTEVVCLTAEVGALEQRVRMRLVTTAARFAGEGEQNLTSLLGGGGSPGGMGGAVGGQAVGMTDDRAAMAAKLGVPVSGIPGSGVGTGGGMGVGVAADGAQAAGPGAGLGAAAAALQALQESLLGGGGSQGGIANTHTCVRTLSPRRKHVFTPSPLYKHTQTSQPCVRVPHLQ
jgi:hypothetical protein